MIFVFKNLLIGILIQHPSLFYENYSLIYIILLIFFFLLYNLLFFLSFLHNNLLEETWEISYKDYLILFLYFLLVSFLLYCIFFSRNRVIDLNIIYFNLCIIYKFFKYKLWPNILLLFFILALLFLFVVFWFSLLSYIVSLISVSLQRLHYLLLRFSIYLYFFFFIRKIYNKIKHIFIINFILRFLTLIPFLIIFGCILFDLLHYKGIITSFFYVRWLCLYPLLYLILRILYFYTVKYETRIPDTLVSLLIGQYFAKHHRVSFYFHWFYYIKEIADLDKFRECWFLLHDEYPKVSFDSFD